MELRHAGHCAVFVHDFADDAAGARAQREDVAGAGEVLRAGFWIDGGEDGDGAIGGADAGGDAEATVNGFGEGGAVDGGVDGGHERQVKLVAALLGEGQADEAAAVLGHEVDGFGRDFFGGHGEVAFVLAVFVVDEDDHTALANVFYGVFYGGEIGWVRGHWYLIKLVERLEETGLEGCP